MAVIDINELKRRMQGALGVLKTELNGLRTGRASAHLLDPIHVEAYGAEHGPQPGRHRQCSPAAHDQRPGVGSLDGHAVEKAIMAANLGLTPSSEGQVIHLRIPELNQERRKELVKVAHKYAETAKVAVRHVRRDGMDGLKKMEKDHQISQDDHKRMEPRSRRRPIRRFRYRPPAVRQGKGDHDGLNRFAMPQNQHPIVGVAMPRPCRHHHGWQRALGVGAGPAARGGAPARRRSGAQDRACRWRMGISFLTIFSFSAENWSDQAVIESASRNRYAAFAHGRRNSARGRHRQMARAAGEPVGGLCEGRNALLTLWGGRRRIETCDRGTRPEDGGRGAAADCEHDRDRDTEGQLTSRYPSLARWTQRRPGSTPSGTPRG